MTWREQAQAIRAVLEQVTAFHIGDARRFNEAVAAVTYLDALSAYISELEASNTESKP